MTVKRRIAVPANTEVHGPGAPHVVVLKEGAGLTTWVDSLKGWYKGAIALVGAVVVILNELTPLFSFIPGPKAYVTTAVAILTAILTALKSNEHWVDDA